MQLGEADQRVFHYVSTHPSFRDKTKLGVAVSGGSDSVALLHLMAAHAKEQGIALEAATVDHGLRPEAQEEAAFVAELCAGLGVPHEILKWGGWDGGGNLQAEARKARYRLLADWSRRRTAQVVALGHTKDDQAETFLMRLAREAGVDGLSAMDAEFDRDGARFCRPAMLIEREELRAFLVRHHIRWCDDPSNEDESFDRVKARKALWNLGDLGIDAGALLGVSLNMSGASHALKHCSKAAAERLFALESGDLVCGWEALMQEPVEIQRRLLIAALNWVAPSGYPPRRDAVEELSAALVGQKPFTLQGCLISSSRDEVRFTREYNAVRDLTCASDEIWDGRWQLGGPKAPGLKIAALGENAMKDIEDWRETGLPRASLIASPAVWQGARLIAAPLAGLENGWSARLIPGRDDFAASVLSH